MSREYDQYLSKPEKNSLLIFPSWLPHYVENTNREEDRLSIAFDTEIYKK